MIRGVIIPNGKGGYDLAHIDTNRISSRSERYCSGDKLVRLDTEGSEKYIVATGFYRAHNRWFVRDTEDNLVDEDNVRRPNSMEFDRFSKYPDTVALRTYLNEKYLEDKPKIKQGPHLHFDDFMSVYNGRLNVSHHHLNYHKMGNDIIQVGNHGSYIDANFNGGRHGYHNLNYFGLYEPYHYSDHPYKDHRPLCGFRLHGPFLLEREKFELSNFHRGWYDERDPVYVKREDVDDTWCPLKLWDPVSEIVRVERICGNDTFISEFGYICSMRMYALISGAQYARWRLVATDFD